MNEVLAHREVKRVMRYGVSKHVAKDVVEVAMSVTSRDLTKAINYALTLTYGVGFLKNVE